MRVLIVKTSSLGDVIHTLPALQEAVSHCPDLKVDWVVEDAFKEIPAWHPSVGRVIPIRLRHWRKSWLQAWKSKEIEAFVSTLRESHYDLVLDAQGLMKSALVSVLARGPRAGLDRHSARESLSSIFYQQSHAVPKGQHAISRLRQLFSSVFQYPNPESTIDYGIPLEKLKKPTLFTLPEKPYVVFLHATTWSTKHWPEKYWQQLITIASEDGVPVVLPWGNAEEQARAERLSAFGGIVMPRLPLSEVAYVLARAKGCVAVDTGLGHVAAAVGTPTVSLYGPTNPGLTGALGPNQVHLSASKGCAPCFKRTCSLPAEQDAQPPCFAALAPHQVWSHLKNTSAGLSNGSVLTA